jgi:catechol 2,3-dioxygenase-like lactoylglutathione lyase family enzyme
MTMEQISRRALLAAVPAFAATLGRGFAQSPAPIPVRKLTYFGLNVSDVGRSVDFYQGLFGMPIQARQGSTVLLRVGSGPQFLALAPAGGAPPRIDRLGLSVQGFDADRVMQQLFAHGLTAGDGSEGSLSGGPMKARLVQRGATRELFFGDPDGIVVQLHDPAFSGGGGKLGETCGPIEASPKKGLLAVQDWSHLTAFVGDAGRANAFYQRVFGLNVQARQGPTAPLLGVGDRIQFIMFGGGFGARGGGQPRPASINHICLNMAGFDRDGILKTLESYGIKPRGNTPGTPPLISYVSLRMPNRGGAPEGTPELYFTDPDGLLIQLQDVRYCGGSGYLGDVCS